MIKKLLVIIVLSFQSFAQESIKDTQTELNAERQKHKLLVQQQLELTKQMEEQKEYLQKQQNKVRALSDEIKNHDEQVKQNKLQINTLVEEELKLSKIKFTRLKSFNSEIQRTQYRKYLKCLKNESIYKKELIDAFSSCAPLKNNAQKFKGQDNSVWEKINHLEQVHQKSKDEKKIDYQTLRDEYRKVDLIYQKNRVQIKVVSNSKIKAQRNIESLETVLEDKLFEKEYSTLLNCNSDTPTIDLELPISMEGTKKIGTMTNITQDNQDGLGTCYANTAKNILAGLSGGKIDASFLDMALQHKILTEKEGINNLDQGSTCTALNKIKETGYCPKKDSPIESGENSLRDSGFVTKEGDIYSQAVVLNLLDDYLKGKSSLENSDIPFAKELTKHSNKMVKALQENPNIILPFPRIEGNPLSDENSLSSNYRWQYIENLQNKEMAISKENYEADFYKINSEFEKEFLTNLKSDFSAQKQRQTYLKHFSPFIKKYNLSERFNDEYTQGQFDRFIEKNANAQKYKLQMQETLNFYKEVLGKDFNTDKIQRLLDPSCSDYSNDFENYFKGLKEISTLGQHLSQTSMQKFNDMAFELSNKDVLQMAIAPNCLNPKNRVPIKLDFKCSYNFYGNNYDKSIIRKDIMKQLTNGIPVGRSYPNSIGGNHINTIVGFRFNTEFNRCEFKIRESMTGQSSWQSEDGLYKVSSYYTTIKKVKDE